MFNQQYKLNNENEKNNSLLLCPNCQNELLNIYSMDYDDRINEYIINYACSLINKNNKNNETKKMNLKQFLKSQNSNSNTSKNFPSYCPYHEFNPAPFFCPECNDNLCKDCYIEHLLYEQDHEHFEKFYKNKKNCKIHKNNKIINYCKECKKYICSQCLNEIHFGHFDRWADIENDFYEKFNKIINRKIKNINIFIKNSLNNLEQIIERANKLKKFINEYYNNYFNSYLPIINLYKLYLFKSNYNCSNDINKIINNFNFNDLYHNLSDKYNSNN